ncbi:MAG: hypothetical protein IPP88_22380 [Betaproteobacteria bacterium]|nr:hypothetical protein [Betaproteobacteria bacterium]
MPLLSAVNQPLQRGNFSVELDEGFAINEPHLDCRLAWHAERETVLPVALLFEVEARVSCELL